MGLEPSQSVAGGLKELPEHKQKEMMGSYAAFYGVDDGDAKVSKLSYNKLYQASRTGGGSKDPMQGVPQDMRNDPTFKQAQKRFYQNDVSDTASQFNAAQAKFFDGGAVGKLNASNTIGEKFQNVQESIVPTQGQRYNNDKAAFFGTDGDARSTGSAFMANTAAFYGQDKPNPGFKI